MTKLSNQIFLSISLLLVLSLSTPSFAENYKVRSVPFLSSSNAGTIEWLRNQILVGRVTDVPLNPNQPLKPCSEIIQSVEAAKPLFEEKTVQLRRISEIIEEFRNATSEQIPAIKIKIREVLAKLDDLQRQIAAVFPASLQLEDRVRTIQWVLKSSDFFDPLYFQKELPIEWGKLKIARSETGYYGVFRSHSPDLRPTLVRFEQFLSMAHYLESEKKELRDILQQSLAHVEESINSRWSELSSAIDWQGHTEILLVQNLSPLKSCTDYTLLQGELALDISPQPNNEDPNSTSPQNRNFLMGSGRVMLVYFVQ